MLSILRYIADECSGVAATLIYSAKDFQELLFYDEISGLEIRNKNKIRCFFTTTGYQQEGTERPEAIRKGRINLKLLQEATSHLGADELQEFTHFLLSGPSGMVDAVNDMIATLKVSSSRIHFEKW
jgi:ferredoxin-NADP reductase